MRMSVGANGGYAVTDDIDERSADVRELIELRDEALEDTDSEDDGEDSTSEDDRVEIYETIILSVAQKEILAT